MSRRVYYSRIGRGETPFEDLRWQMVEMTGWTLEYIDALRVGDIHEYLQVLDGRAKSQRSFFNRPHKGDR